MVTAENVLLREALENAGLFAKYIETLGRTDCEIYKHELKGSADLSLSRIEKALHATPQTAKIQAVLDAAVDYVGEKNQGACREIVQDLYRDLDKSIKAMEE